MIRAIIRPEKEEEVIKALENVGFVALTKMDVFGRGKQMGIQMGEIRYDELPKTLLILVVNDRDAAKVSEVIAGSARTGNYGDGKIFVSEISEVYTIRTGREGL